MNKLLRLLFVEDSPADAELMVRLIRREGIDFTSLRVDSREDFLLVLPTFQPDIVVTDYSLPDFDGMEAIKLAMEFDETLPVIVVTGFLNETIAVESARAGAVDYIYKDHIARLPYAIQGALERRRIQRGSYHALDALKRSEEQFRILFETMTQGVVYEDSQGKIISANPAAEQILGLTLEQMQAAVWSVMNEDGSRCLTEEYPVAIARKTGEAVHHAIKGVYNPRLDQYRWLRIHAVPILQRRENGGGHVYIMFEDITDRKQAEEALLASERKVKAAQEWFRIIYQLNPVAMSIVSVIEQTIIDVNLRWEGLTGYSAQELIGRKVSELDWLAGLYGRAHAINQACQEHVHDREITVWTKQGEEIIVLTSVQMIEIGGEQYYLNVIDDITRYRQLQNEMIRLERLESIGVLAGGIAHDFNNILTIILGYLSIARKRVNQPDIILKSLEELENAASQARALTMQLLTFAKGGRPIKRVTAIDKLLVDAVTFALHGSSIHCSFDFAVGLHNIEADYDQISQVINNLILNAQQAMPSGGIIFVHAENVLIHEASNLPLDYGEYVKIEVTDSGVGIPKEICHNIFDPYFTTKSTGTGLGLATSYSIIKQHHGFIAVNSEVGVGTTFILYLPASPQAAAEHNENYPGLKTGTGRVLVMDDEEPIRKLSLQMLPLLGYDVECACDGFEAIALYERAQAMGKPYSAVILDLTIRGSMGGRETIQRLIELDPDVKAIVSSGYTEDAVLADYHAYGFRAIVSKPYRLEELAEALFKVITL